MPIYEFECPTCEKHFDRLQKLSDPDPTQCPSCMAQGVRRCLTAPSFRLAGSGWYETDFKKDGDKQRNLAKSDDAPQPAKTDPPPKSDSGGDTAGKVAKEAKAVKETKEVKEIKETKSEKPSPPSTSSNSSD
jgi:putative FmdB family regulatory protein